MGRKGSMDGEKLTFKGNEQQYMSVSSGNSMKNEN